MVIRSKDFCFTGDFIGWLVNQRISVSPEDFIGW